MIKFENFIKDSQLYIIGDDVVSKSDYLEYLGESFSISETNYGTNLPKFNNSVVLDVDSLEKEIKKNNHRLTVKRKYSQIFVSFFQYEKRFYQVSIFKKTNNMSKYWEVGFSASAVPTTNYLKYSDSILSGTENPIGVVNRVFYIFQQILKKTNEIQDIMFTTEDSRVSLYQKIIENKMFIKMMKELGFIFKDKQENFWLYEREV